MTVFRSFTKIPVTEVEFARARGRTYETTEELLERVLGKRDDVRAEDNGGARRERVKS